MVNSLLERGLIRIAGRADVPGRPLLYETTEFFLEHFGLKTLDELPNVAELRRINLPTAPVPTPSLTEQKTETSEPSVSSATPAAEPPPAVEQPEALSEAQQQSEPQ
jgi:segregation and condensation protein B